MSKEMHEQIYELANSIYSTTAINNEFYDLWMSKRLDHRQLTIFSLNYYKHVEPTIDRISLAFMKSKHPQARKQMIENMADELGMHGKPHPQLLQDFLIALLSKSARKEINFRDLLQEDPIPATKKLLEAGIALFSDERQEVACGALLAQEWHAFTQLIKLYEGARNYLDLFDLEEFHEKCEYFHVHIGAAEKEHKEQAISIASALVTDSDSFNLLKLGFDSYVESLSDYWTALYKAIKSAESKQ